MPKRLKKNISFSPSEKDIYDFLSEVPNASALIKELVLGYMLEIGYYKGLDERIKKTSMFNYVPKFNNIEQKEPEVQETVTETKIETQSYIKQPEVKIETTPEVNSEIEKTVPVVPKQNETKVDEEEKESKNKELALKLARNLFK